MIAFLPAIYLTLAVDALARRTARVAAAAADFTRGCAQIMTSPECRITLTFPVIG